MIEDKMLPLALQALGMDKNVTGLASVLMALGQGGNPAAPKNPAPVMSGLTGMNEWKRFASPQTLAMLSAPGRNVSGL